MYSFGEINITPCTTKYSQVNHKSNPSKWNWIPN